MTGYEPYDDEIAAALRTATRPVRSEPAVEQIATRARQLRLRRRAVRATGAAGLGVLAVSAVALGLPVAIWDRTAGMDVTSGGASLCAGAVIRDESASRQSPADVPPELRLLWSADAADNPTHGSIAILDGLSCESPASVKLVDVEAGHVVRTVEVSGPQQSVVYPGAGWTEIEAGADVEMFTGGDQVWAAKLIGEEQHLVVHAGGLSTDEVAAIVAVARVDASGVDLAGWDGVVGMDHVVESGPGAAPSRVRLGLWHVESADARLEVHAGGGGADIWETAAVGFQVVDVNGRPGFLFDQGGKPDSALWWSPNDEVRALLHSTTSDPVEIARTVRPVDVDDERLADVDWPG